jgi:hypothetical protein
MDAAIAYGRAVLDADAFTTPVDILTAGATRDARNAVTESWSNAGVVTVNGRLMQPGGADRRTLAGVNIAGTAYVVGLPIGTVVTVKNRLRVGGKMLAVLSVDNEGTDILYVRCLCYQVNQ